MNYSEPNPALYNLPGRFHDFHGMPYRQLGKSGLCVSEIGLGTWKFGYPETGDGSRIGLKLATRIFDRAWELGVTFWDTANRYNLSSGNSERVIGQWIKNNPEKRRDIILATKLWGGMDGKTPNHWGLSRANILDSVHASLQRLNCDYIDVLYFHHPHSCAPIDESLLAVEDLIREGAIRYFAVSNMTLEKLEEYNAFIDKNAPMRTRICAVQNQFDLLRGEADAYPGVLDYCAKKTISFVGWSPFAKGLLTGNPDALTSDIDAGLTDKIKRLTSYAESMKVSLPVLTLAYMLKLPGMGPVIPSCSSVSQLEDNAHAAKLELSDAQISEIKEILK